jgi:hypothetical protein
MPPRRRDRKIIDPKVEREMLRRRDGQITDLAGDISKAESENEAGNKEEEVAVEYAAKECLFRSVARIATREKMNIPVYEGNLDVEEILDWIIALDKYFNYEDVEEDKKVKHSVTRLKGHVTLCWEEL